MPDERLQREGQRLQREGQIEVRLWKALISIQSLNFLVFPSNSQPVSHKHLEESQRFVESALETKQIAFSYTMIIFTAFMQTVFSNVRYLSPLNKLPDQNESMHAFFLLVYSLRRN